MSGSLNASLLIATIGAGLSCAFACGPLLTFFLGSWISVSDSDHRKGFLTVLQFLIGKSAVYMAAVAFSSIAGAEIQKKAMFLLGSKADIAFNIFLILLGGYFLFKVLHQKKCHTCKSSCGITDFNVTPLKVMLAGAAYALTPCYPMTVLMINAAMLPLTGALILGAAFSIASCINPLLFIGMFSGRMSQEMRKEISNAIQYFQIGLSGFFVALGSFGLSKVFGIL
ncbi:MAG: hypothetical protein H6Q73_4000 [Firmicutes bacterium]|nr:hypothetical protein [Bacillota bacterium]